MTEQLDLTEHVFRSVRGWLHQLFPDDLILIERRQDWSLTPDDAAAGAETPNRPVWHLSLVTGPMWREHTAASSMSAYSIKATKRAVDLWDAQRSVGRAQANAVRPGGNIPLHAYNLTYPQQPNITGGVLDGEDEPWPSETVDVAVAPADADGNPLTRPCLPVTIATPVGAFADIDPLSWPFGGLGPRWAIYAAPEGETLQLQGTCAFGSTFRLDATVIGEGPTAPTNLRVPLRGLRVESAESAVQQLTTDGEDAWDASLTLGLVVQVPRVLAAHLAPLLRP